MEAFRHTVRTDSLETSRCAAASRIDFAQALLITIWTAAILSAIGNPIAAHARNKAEDSERVAEASDPTNLPKVELGRLLKLPDSYLQPAAERRGMRRSKWENRFESVRLELSSAKKALAKAQSELAKTANESSSWAVAAPGIAPNPENTPLSYKLRQEIRRQRETVQRAERQLLALEIEADLADVPEPWRASEVVKTPDL